MAIPCGHRPDNRTARALVSNLNRTEEIMGNYAVARVSELPPGARKIIELEGRSIGVFNIKGAYYALRNTCPHQGAPLCSGAIKGTLKSEKPQTYEIVKEGEILVCPWHCWEFDITTGGSVFNPHRMRVRSYEVTVEPEEDDPSVETYPVSVESGFIVVHI